MSVETDSYAHFSQLLHGKVAQQRIPVTATLEVSRRCPLACSHCYNNLPMNDAVARRGELTLQEIERILDEMADAGVLWLLLSGGEIFARRDFLDIYDAAKRRGFLITLFTNGTLITERIADHLAKSRPFAIEITLYGHTKKTYDALTRVPGSWERCRRGIELLVERKLPLKLKTVAVRENLHEVFEMERWSREQGIEFKFDSMINPRIDCSDAPLAQRLTPEETVSLDLAHPQRLEEWRQLAADYGGSITNPGEVYHCGGGINSFSIDPAGVMTICVLSHREGYDLRRGSLTDGWNGFMKDVRSKKRTRPTKCDDCHIKAVCGMCPANAELDSGDPEEPVDFLCRTAHLRAEVFGIEVKPHGSCEYCEGGSGREWLNEAVSSLDTSVIDSAPPVTPGASRGCSSDPCGSCSV